MQVSASLRTFLSQLIDYAGAFPPAQLPLDVAFRNYAGFLSEADAWMLGRFVCPAARLSELTAACPDLLSGTSRYPFSILGRGGKNTQEFFANLKADVADIQRFLNAFPTRVNAEAYEVRLPPSAFAPAKPHQLASLIATTAYLLETSGPAEVSPFFEAPLTDRASLLATIQALHEDHHSGEVSGRQRCQKPGFKLRTGGLEAAAVPSVEQVALVLAACRAAQVPFKATAGLHHPLRHVDATLQSPMHGFVNVFAAGCLSWPQPVTEAQLQAIVADESPTNFRWTAEGLHWQDRFASTATIAQARRLFTSFGSCSFDEPRADLRHLGWL